MTEAEWITCTSPKPMLEFLRGSGSERKLRLFAALCCRRVWHYHDRPPGFADRVILASEGAADGLVGTQELKAVEVSVGALGSYSAKARAMDVARTAVYRTPGDAAMGASECAVSYFALAAMESLGEEPSGRQAFGLAQQLENTIQAALLREIFGNPLRPKTVNPAWLTVEVVDLAREADSDPTSHRCLLAAALTRAGCDDADILAHCNQIGGHVNGCWVVDLLLGKK